jgi:uroporphyrinogen decarboxylase
VDILNPIEPDVPGNNPKALKSAFGSEIVFHGHLDNKRALSGSSADARQEVRRIFDGMGPGGGYIMAPTNHIQADVSPEALIEVYRTAQEYGRYRPGGS